ncbi:MAG TPA: outer membrane protein transport protein [Candidatus Acidoferrum sp.]|nr:outer membrane protein transport protein [Candidatus Acidoferrum sp.]
MKTARILVLISAAFAGSALVQNTARAGGLFLYELGTPDVGLASAGYSARAQDASTLFKNPAGMSLLDGAQLQSGLQVLYGDVKFSNNGSKTSSFLGTENGGNSVGALPGANLFITYPVTEKLAVGFGTFSYFGLKIDYNNDWVGRYYVQNGTLLGMTLMPAASFKVNDWLSIGGGLNAMYGYMDTEVALRTLAPGDGTLKLRDEQWGFGGIGGIIITPREGTRLGVTYLSEVKLDFSDKPSLHNLGPLGVLPVFQNPPTLNLGVTVPQSVMFGIWQKLNEKWAVMADVGWQNWSRFGEVEVGFDAAHPNSLTANLHYDDTWHGAIGAQYTASDKWQFTGGFAYDTSAVSDAHRTVMLPIGPAYRFGLGALWKYSKNLDFNAAYEFIWSGDLPVTQGAPGDYRGEVSGSYNNVWFSFFTVNLTWRF